MFTGGLYSNILNGILAMVALFTLKGIGINKECKALLDHLYIRLPGGFEMLRCKLVATCILPCTLFSSEKAAVLDYYMKLM